VANSLTLGFCEGSYVSVILVNMKGMKKVNRSDVISVSPELTLLKSPICKIIHIQWALESTIRNLHPIHAAIENHIEDPINLAANIEDPIELAEITHDDTTTTPLNIDDHIDNR
jgi:hypothetical protein